MHKLFFLFLIILIATCATTTKFYIKARNKEEVKIGAFEICGKNFNILTYEEDTALISCIKKK